jgi:O-antigen/teichoic acid export membrane protein
VRFTAQRNWRTPRNVSAVLRSAQCILGAPAFVMKFGTLHSRFLVVLPLIKGTAWTLGGYSFSFFAAVVCVPMLMRDAGASRYAVFALSMLIVGSAGILDVGVGRALTGLVIGELNAKDRAGIARYFLAAGIVLFIVALTINIFAYLYMPAVARYLSGGDEYIVDEVLVSCRLLLCSLPFVFLQVLAISALEATEDFRAVALIRGPTSALLYLIPTVISQYWQDLVYICAALVLVKSVGSVVFAVAAFNALKAKINLSFSWRRDAIRLGSTIKELFAASGWISFSNIAGPVLVNSDRFMLMGVLGAAAVATYSAPYELISRISIVAAGVSSVMYARFAHARHDPGAKADLAFRTSVFFIACVLGPFVLLVFLFARPLADFWLADLVSQETPQLICLFSAGYLIHGLVQPAYVWLQANGHAKYTAINHAAELVIYFTVFSLFVVHYGVLGAAYSWILRMGFSLVSLHSLRYYLAKC